MRQLRAGHRLLAIGGLTTCLLACSEPATELPAPPATELPVAPATAVQESAPGTSRLDAAPLTLDAVLEQLRARDLAAAADVIAARTTQAQAKFRLTSAEALACARYLLTEQSPDILSLHQVMSRSTVELVRAIHERDLSRTEADRIARYLVAYVHQRQFQRLDNFDRNHAHVTGRSFSEIDYSGERMTWQGQQQYWSARGVPDFKSADHIRSYLRQAEKMPHFARVYRPRN